MSKKQKQCQGRDTYHRMNYLYQASKLMAGRNDFLSSYLGHQCRAIGKKSVLKMEPAVKRTICKRCSIFLKPEETADVEVEDTGRGVCVISCRRCGFQKRYHNDGNYSMWLDNPASVAESLNFASDSSASSSKGQQPPTVSRVNGHVAQNATRVHEKSPIVPKTGKEVAKEGFPVLSSCEKMQIDEEEAS
ncbi:ribonuclease P protein subunit p21 [Lutzomyia longipalpis]|uniref:ribonuclease P protein subunit p21 n=1 Tax=Lutzomyia longipalpis TaxID=7200 RepID=UPI002483F790|nr:ribonuclease P protein subunit p21 [Lutzomyia longipalpis]